MLTERALAVLDAYGWPGTCVSLQNVVQRAVLLADGEQIDADDLPQELRSGPTVSAWGNAAWRTSRNITSAACSPRSGAWPVSCLEWLHHKVAG